MSCELEKGVEGSRILGEICGLCRSVQLVGTDDPNPTLFLCPKLLTSGDTERAPLRKGIDSTKGMISNKA